MPSRFAEVTPNEVFRGGRPSIEDVKILKDVLGVKRILSLDLKAGFDINPYVIQFGIDHIIYPLLHGKFQEQEMKRLSNEIPDLFSIKPIYIHCVHGRDRTGLVIALYRIQICGWGVEQSLEEAKKYGFPEGLSPGESAKFLNTINEAGGKPSAVDQVRDIYTQDPVGTSDLNVNTKFGPEKLSDNGTYQDSYLNENMIDSQFVKDRRYKKLKDLIDKNDLMAEVGGYENNNPMVYGLGQTIDPFGTMYPIGLSMLY